MKQLAFLIFLLPIAVAGQSTTSYDQVMEKFQKFYNAGHGDSINAMFGHEWDQMKSSTTLWTNKSNDDLLKEFGFLKSYKFIGIDTSDPNRGYVFETSFSKKGAKTTSLTLDSDNNLSTFRFITISDGITKLLKKSRRSR